MLLSVCEKERSFVNDQRKATAGCQGQQDEQAMLTHHFR